MQVGRPFNQSFSGDGQRSICRTEYRLGSERGVEYRRKLTWAGRERVQSFLKTSILDHHTPHQVCQHLCFHPDTVFGVPQDASSL